MNQAIQLCALDSSHVFKTQQFDLRLADRVQPRPADCDVTEFGRGSTKRLFGQRKRSAALPGFWARHWIVVAARGFSGNIDRVYLTHGGHGNGGIENLYDRQK